MIRRLTTDDADLVREAWRWDESRPTWFRQMDSVFNPGTVEDLVAQLADNRKAFIGVWDTELTAIILIEHHAGGCFEGHFMARRGTSPELIARVVSQLLHDMLDYGLNEAFVWVAEKNVGVRQLCATIGFSPDGIVMYKGAYRGRVIKWLRYSIQREQVEMAQAA